MTRVIPLGSGVDYFDLHFVGMPGIIATGMIHGPDGVALVDPGPSTALPVVERALAARGFGWNDITAVLLTHIHLDHAGSAGTITRLAPNATVYVHERGAIHLADPSKLLASASRLYLDMMDTLWGEVAPVPQDRMTVLTGATSFNAGGRDVAVDWTPGHAWHHVSYFLPDVGVAFVGDTGGMSRPSGRLVIPPTPPPDIDLEAWRDSTDRILRWNPTSLFLTHFGPVDAPRVHVQALWTAIDDWSGRVRASLTRDDLDDTARAELFVESVMNDIARSASRAEAESYAKAGRFDFSWTGLARYWRKKAQ
jgi:glyoxylase-like metal-dependent hydrolase (beta-lactamase superfamily II)